jgi:hypothetical protein
MPRKARRVRRVRRKRGGASTAVRRVAPAKREGLLTRIKNVIKKHKLASKGLKFASAIAPEGAWKAGLSHAGDFAESQGYGRRRRRTVRRRRGRGFFDFFKKAGRWIKDKVVDKVKKPSTWLGLASNLPTPLSAPLKVASIASGLAGHGRRRRGGRRLGVRRMMGSGSFSTEPIFP